MKLKKGDTVLITTGKDKGKKGTVERVFPETHKVLVEGVNQYKRHIKARMADQTSEIRVLSRPLPDANVALVCKKCEKPTRVGYKTVNDEKVRICRKCKEQI